MLAGLGLTFRAGGAECLQGFFIPPLGLLLKRLTGSWAPLFVTCGAVNWVMCLLFANFSSLEPARDSLAKVVVAKA